MRAQILGENSVGARAQIARIADLQAAAGATCGGHAVRVGGPALASRRFAHGAAAFLVEMRKALPASEVAARFSSCFPGVSFNVAPLFDEDAPRFFLLSFCGISFADLGGGPFEIAYLLAGREDVASAEPDLEISHDAPAGRLGREAPDARTSQLALLRSIRAEKAWRTARGQGVTIALIGARNEVWTEYSATSWLRPPAAPDRPQVGGWKHAPLDPSTFSGNPPKRGGDRHDKLADRDLERPCDAVSAVAPNAELITDLASGADIQGVASSTARAIDAARRRKADIIAVDVDGLPSRALFGAIDAALAENIIVLTKAPKAVEIPAFPACYRGAVAVGAVGRLTSGVGAADLGDSSFFGVGDGSEAIAFCAPAGASGGDGAMETAIAAGIAALWLSAIGRAAAVASLAAGETLQRRFRSVMSHCACAQGEWDYRRFGAGVLDAARAAEFGSGEGAGGAAWSAEPAIQRQLYQISRQVAPALNEIADRRGELMHLRADDPDIEQFGQEIVWLKRLSAVSMASGSAEGRRADLDALMSEGLKKRLRTRPDLCAILYDPGERSARCEGWRSDAAPHQ